MRFATEGMEADDAVRPILGLTMAGGDYFQKVDIGLLGGSYFVPNANPTNDVRVIVSRSGQSRTPCAGWSLPRVVASP
jgi:hypothetical protein